jgi:hypothetical protein
MEYVWKCFDDEGVTKKAGNRKITIFIIYLALILILTLAVAVYSYAAESLTLEEAVETALRNNPGLKTSDDQVEAADAGVLRSVSGFLPKVTLSETWSKTDNPLMVLGTKLNQEIVNPVTGCCLRKEYHKVALQSIETSAMNDENLLAIKNTRR